MFASTIVNNSELFVHQLQLFLKKLNSVGVTHAQQTRITSSHSTSIPPYSF